jgi:hypothetical protein
LGKDPELTFHQVKYYAEDKFAETDLKQLKRAYSNTKKEFKEQLKMVAEYFKFPKNIC